MSFASTMTRVGAPVTFSKEVPGDYDAGTDTSAPPSTLTITGTAMQVRGDPNLYLQLQLIESENPTLLFRPDMAGVLPVLGMTVAWGNEPALTVKSVVPLAMNGVATAAKIVVSR